MLATEYPLPRASISFTASSTTEATAHTDASQTLSMKLLCDAKKNVPAAIKKVGQRRWNELVNRDGIRTTSAAVNRAYHKLNEVRASCALPECEMSVHLCESPGGFVRSTATDASSSWRWIAMSHASGPAPARDDLPMDRGEFLEGDVYDTEWCAANLPAQTADFVTADGATDMDHDHLETAHAPLLLAQCHCAFRCLRPGGHFVVKFFEGGNSYTVAWIAWMTNAFDTVSIIKPNSSRPTNSERYLVCRNFLATPQQGVPDATHVASGWMAETKRILDRLAETQTQTLNDAIQRAMAFR